MTPRNRLLAAAAACLAAATGVAVVAVAGALVLAVLVLGDAVAAIGAYACLTRPVTRRA
jgi:hypothetical protein